MAAKPFASSADLGVKEQTLEVLADGVYALTAEGDPNVGAIEGEDFLVCFEALATPVAARRWLAKLREHTDKPVRYLVLAHYHAVRVLGASAFDAEVIVAHEKTKHAHRRARQAGLGERVRPDAAAVRGARVDPRPDLADADLPRPADHRPRRRPRRAGAGVPAAAGTPRATSSPGCPSRRSSSPATSSSPRPRSTPATRSTSTGPPAPWTGSRPSAPRQLIGGRGAVARGRDGGRRGRSSRPATSSHACIRDGRRGARARRHAEGRLRRHPRRARPDSTARWPIFEHCLPFDVSRLWDEFAASSAR